MVADQRRQGAARDNPHGEEHPVVLADPAERRDDVWVVHPQRLLPDETQQRRRIGLAQHLGGDKPVQLQVAGTPHRAHATFANRVDELVPAAENLTHRRRRSSAVGIVQARW